MAGLAGLILREVAMQAVRRMAPAAGAAIVAGTANEIRKKQEEADKAKDTPLARTAAQAKADECAKGAKKCEECPADKGVSWQRNFKERRVWVDYQARMCGMPNGPNFIMEWIFNTVTFNGFDSSQCHLTEAKQHTISSSTGLEALNIPFREKYLMKCLRRLSNRISPRNRCHPSD